MQPESNANSRSLRRAGWALSLLCLLALLALAPAPAVAKKPRCAGKRATIVSGAPRITGSKAHDVIVARGGDSVVFGAGGNDTICARGGDDLVYGGRGNDDLFGEGGDDTLVGERGSDDLDGGAAADRLFGATGNDEITGAEGARDQVFGGPGDDSLGGGDGDLDVLAGGPGNDRIDGGPGAHDIASYAGTGGTVTVDLASGTVGGAEGEHLSGVEDAIGGAGDDALLGSGEANRLDGGAGEDRLLAAGAGDEAFGGPGSDSCSGFGTDVSCGSARGGGGTTVEVYRGIDAVTSLVVVGNGARDSATVSFDGSAYVVSGGGGNPVLAGNGCTRDPAANSVACPGPVDRIQAALGDGDDSLAVDGSVPTAVAAHLEGGAGSDSLLGGPGEDTLYAGDDRSPDALAGGDGDDVLYGVNIFHPRNDSGAARMAGGPGDDLLIGGQPCDGDSFEGGEGDNDSASFARVNNSGVNVEATIGGPVLDPDVGDCTAGRIDAGVEKIEGSPGDDVLSGDSGPNTLLGRGGNDRLDGSGAFDDCVGAGGSNQLANCEYANEGPRFKRKPPAQRQRPLVLRAPVPR